MPTPNSKPNVITVDPKKVKVYLVDKETGAKTELKFYDGPFELNYGKTLVARPIDVDDRQK